MAIGDLAKKAPPPDRLVKGMPGEDALDGGADDAEEGDAAVRAGLAEDIIAALKEGPDALAAALDAYLDARG